MKWLEINYPEKHAWLLEEENGITRAESRSIYTIDDRIELIAQLTEIREGLL